jgi:hypothetical protein
MGRLHSHFKIEEIRQEVSKIKAKEFETQNIAAIKEAR